jgi:hypothetical protein
MSSEILDFVKKMHQKGFLWSYSSEYLEHLPPSILIEHVLIYGNIEDIQQLFELFEYKRIQKVWKMILVPNPNHRKLNYYLAIFYFHYKNPKRLLNRQYETRLERLQRLAA